MTSLKNNSVSIISFFFNEVDNINAFIKKAYNLINNVKRFGIKVVFIVIDDGSYDGSYEKIKKLKFNGIKIFRNKKIWVFHTLLQKELGYLKVKLYFIKH